MNAVEIEEAISTLAEQVFDAAEFPFAFLTAFGNKETTIKRLRSGASNRSDCGGVLQTSNIHLASCPPGEVGRRLATLRASPATGRAKARFILATDGEVFEAKDLSSGGDGCLSSAFASDLFHVQARRSDRSAMCHSGFIDVMLVVGHGR